MIPRLLAISDVMACGGVDGFVRHAMRLAEAGLPALMLRERRLSPRELLELGRRLKPGLRAAGCLLVINDRIDVALALDADGVQLPGGALPVAEARRILPRAALIGKSCHNAAELAEARSGGADWALLSPFRAPKSHPSELPPLGPEGFALLVRDAELPVLALGGIEPSDIAPAIAAGAWGVAAITGLMSPDACVESWLQELERAGKNSRASSSPG